MGVGVAMPYTHKVLAFAWLLVFGLFALAGSGAVSGSWVLLLILAAGGAPLILRLGATAPPAPKVATSAPRGMKGPYNVQNPGRHRRSATG